MNRFRHFILRLLVELSLQLHVLIIRIFVLLLLLFCLFFQFLFEHLQQMAGLQSIHGLRTFEIAHFFFFVFETVVEAHFLEYFGVDVGLYH